MPKVSVVIPAYKAMPYLPETVASVLKQSYTDFEIVIIDDASPDNTLEWARNVADLRVKVISQSNQGTPGARNTGIAHSTGEYLAFLDADDLWEETKLEKQVRTLDGNPALGLVDTWVGLIDQEGKALNKVIASDAEGDIWQRIICGNTICCGSTPMVRRTCFDKVGVFDRDIRFSEDWDMWIRISRYYQFAILKEPLTFYRLHPNSKSKDCRNMEEDFRRIIEKAFLDVPIELLPLRNRSYGCASLYLVWKSLEMKDGVQALHYYRNALAHCSELRYTWDAIRPYLAILGFNLLKPQGYTQAQEILYKLRRRFAA
jgi:glycosyltransferase involved in cell wall biosynthesis